MHQEVRFEVNALRRQLGIWLCFVGRVGLAVALAWLTASASAQPDSPSPAPPVIDAGAGTDAAAPAPAPPDQPAEPQDPRIAQIQALIAGTLDVSVEPQTLFDAPLTDEAALQIAAIRERSLLEAAARAEPREVLPSPPAALPESPANVVAPGSLPAVTVTPDAGVLRAEIKAVEPARWADQLALARARLDFYQLAPERREELLQQHRARQEAARPRETEQERLARQAERERQRALEEAHAARTEAERVVSQEKARLIALQARIDAARAGFDVLRAQLGTERDAVIGWQHRAREARQGSAMEADATYDALRRALWSARNQLSSALDALGTQPSTLPEVGSDPLANVPSGVDIEEVRARRLALVSALAAARKEEQALREQRAATLLDTITSLNHERLGLLPYLSRQRRSAALDFGPEGWEQAAAEVRHLGLILRYHRHVALAWGAALRAGESKQVSFWGLAAVLFPMTLLTVSFVWVRRRVPKWLLVADQRLGDAERAERQATASPVRRAVRLFAKVHRPLEWLAYVLLLQWLLPESARGLLEVQLLTSVVGWIIGGALVVNVINALAAGTHQALTAQRNTIEELRLRSLQIVGRTIVAFALILVLSARLVGKGTIYGWVFSTCWLAAIPVFLALVRLWRSVVFERMQRTRKRSPTQTWVLSNRTGWKSFLAAMVGAVQLFTMGALKLLQNRITGFDLVRRVHAYLFRLELTRLSEGSPDAHLVALDDAKLAAFDPGRPCNHWLANVNDAALQRLDSYLARPATSVLAVVGARGMGKTTLLRELAARTGRQAQLITCAPAHTLERIQQQLCEPSQDGADRTNEPQLVLIDNAHALVRPVIGGLAEFDQLLSLARAECPRRTWVLAIDLAIWPFLRRARDSRPLFEEVLVLEPWTEAEIGALLAERCELSGIQPIYDDLLDKLPRSADVFERAEALQERQVGYIRMLWDHVGGNPALALEAWRNSLGRDALGIVHVRPLQVPDSTRIDALSDASMFILRAVLQLDPASIEDIAQVTRIAPEQVRVALRFGQAEGYYTEQEGRARVSWHWLRAVLRLLERRHLLVNE